MTEKKRVSKPSQLVRRGEDPESALWRNVIMQAIADATLKLPDCKVSNGVTRFQFELIRGQARRWVKQQTEDFKAVCELAGLEHQRVYDLVMSRIREANAKEQARTLENLRGSIAAENLKGSMPGVGDNFSEGQADRPNPATRKTEEIEFSQKQDFRVVSVVQLADMKAHLNVTFTDDDTLIQGKIDAAECWLFTLIGSSPAFPVGFPVQPPVIEAIKLLAAHFYENREASLVGVTSQELPLGVLDLITPYRSWAF